MNGAGAARAAKDGFWNFSIVDGNTINAVTPPELFTVPYPVVLVILAFALTALFFIMRRGAGGRGLVASALAAFTIAGLLSAARMEANWVSMLSKDLSRYPGKSVGERVVETDGHGLYDFMQLVKRTIPGGGAVREMELPQFTPVFYFTKLGNYYLLPTITSRTGSYVWVYYFENSTYDEASGVLRIYDHAFRTRLLAVSGDGGAVFEILEDLP